MNFFERWNRKKISECFKHAMEQHVYILLQVNDIPLKKQQHEVSKTSCDY